MDGGASQVAWDGDHRGMNFMRDNELGSCASWRQKHIEVCIGVFEEGVQS